MGRQMTQRRRPGERGRRQAGRNARRGPTGPTNARRPAWQPLHPREAFVRKALRVYKIAARERGLTWRLTKAQFAALISRPCVFCGLPPSILVRVSLRHEFRRSGIDRLNPAVGYVPNNCVPACSQCNYAKSNRPLAKFKEWLRRAGVFQLSRRRELEAGRGRSSNREDFNRVKCTVIPKVTKGPKP